MKKLLSLVLVILIIISTLSACENEKEKTTITIAEQYGLAYAPVQIMKAQKLLEKQTENIEIKWARMANTAAIREAMLAGQVQVGFIAIPPFLIAKDKGMEWQIICGLSMSPLGLMTSKEEIKSLADISARDRIALPQPGSVQHILLSMAAKREFGDASRFDEQLVTMAHPEGMNALLARQDVSLHFTAPPYLFQESKAKGIHQILSGQEALGGEFTFIVGVATEEFYREYPQVYQAFLKSLAEAIAFINAKPGEAAALLAASYDLPQEEIEEYITWPGMNYTQQVKGLAEFMSFMQEAGYIQLENVEPTQLLWEVDFYAEN